MTISKSLQKLIFLSILNQALELQLQLRKMGSELVNKNENWNTRTIIHHLCVKVVVVTNRSSAQQKRIEKNLT